MPPKVAAVVYPQRCCVPPVFCPRCGDVVRGCGATVNALTVRHVRRESLTIYDQMLVSCSCAVDQFWTVEFSREMSRRLKNIPSDPQWLSRAAVARNRAILTLQTWLEDTLQRLQAAWILDNRDAIACLEIDAVNNVSALYRLTREMPAVPPTLPVSTANRELLQRLPLPPGFRLIANRPLVGRIDDLNVRLAMNEEPDFGGLSPLQLRSAAVRLLDTVAEDVLRDRLSDDVTYRVFARLSPVFASVLRPHDESLKPGIKNSDGLLDPGVIAGSRRRMRLDDDGQQAEL